ncbi:hypothetical protein JW758_03645 [Candidatus Peregrinibacteria bacterium]|nr:hypothetical protein [Candidatus Peregrinibacteria bacterium]
MQTVLSKLFRDIEADLGTHKFSLLVLDALKDALLQYEFRNSTQFKKQLLNIFQLLQMTRPRYAILLNSFYKILEVNDKTNYKSKISELVKTIDRISASYQLEKLQLVRNAQEIDVHNKHILIHDQSSAVRSTLDAMKQQSDNFSVIVAGQDAEKTESNIVFLYNHNIDHKVVPSHMLSHVEKVVDMVFLGAVTIQQNYNFIMDPGSRGIISQFKLEKKPIYVFLTTSKFSLWPLTDKSQESYYNQMQKSHRLQQEIKFSLLKFSHDRVSVDLVDYIVTEKGIFTPDELKDVYDDMFKKRKKERRKYLG